MVRREVDWKLRNRQILDWVTALVVGALVAIYLF
jgi:hypothetical protein